MLFGEINHYDISGFLSLVLSILYIYPVSKGDVWNICLGIHDASVVPLMLNHFQKDLKLFIMKPEKQQWYLKCLNTVTR